MALREFVLRNPDCHLATFTSRLKPVNEIFVKMLNYRLRPRLRRLLSINSRIRSAASDVFEPEDHRLGKESRKILGWFLQNIHLKRNLAFELSHSLILTCDLLYKIVLIIGLFLHMSLDSLYALLKFVCEFLDLACIRRWLWLIRCI